ncbi:antitoxin VbhA family protein [Dyella monticola]|uniref:antitoxin VbhA family protein n=1 Tax=Dyella monticola TaxID=1927958 RepID=UPI000E1D3EAA|nr:antitoxin VbhA family protein [Dyella monticola]
MRNEAEQEHLRRAFHSANSIVALEGWVPTSDALAIQERVIRGELTHDEAVAAHIEAARIAHEKRKTAD